MVKHIVTWKFYDSAEGKTKEENIEIVKNDLLSLKGVISEIKHIELGKDISCTDASYDLVLVTDFENNEDLESYRVHPEHQKIAKYVAKVTSYRGVIDYNF
ncbi:MAG: Dabb family protein [Acutalibacteraceae bacterium]|jgi:hypothetical protein|nr:Dabb family protein [Clostridiales bacterium]